MDLRTCHCRNRRCVCCGKTGPASRLRTHGSDRGEACFRCTACGTIVEARAGTAYADIRTNLQTYERGAQLLAEGMSIRATARVLDVDKDTVCGWVRQVGEHCAGVAAYHFRQLHLTECQLDELWTFVYKKEAHLTAFEKLAGQYGDAWIWIAFDPVHKLVPVWVVGKRTLTNAQTLIKRLKNRLDGHIPFFTSDELPHYADALLAVYGVLVTPPRRFRRGRRPLPRLQPPAELVYAVVVKQRERGRVVQVTTQVVFGTEAEVAARLQASPVSSQISTYGVERNNLTVRQHSRRLSRKVNAFSKAHRYLNYQLALAFAYYHFCCPHRGLRRRFHTPLPTKNGYGSPKKWQPVTPAMAAGLTDHVWTIDELLSFRIPPRSQWKTR